MSEVMDRIERQIEIEAPADRVWKLVEEPGWWVNAGQEVVEHRVEPHSDDPALTTVHDPKHGEFLFLTVRLDEPTYAAFRWVSDAKAPDGPSTLVEFFLEPAANTTVLRVVESGFASLPESDVERRKHYEDNTEGWTIELGLAKSLVEGNHASTVAAPAAVGA